MRDSTDWKKKYLELRRRFVSSMDMAFRAGYEQGSNETQMANMQQQMAQQEAQMMAMQNGGAPGQPGQDPMDDGQGGAPDQQAQGAEDAADAQAADQQGGPMAASMAGAPGQMNPVAPQAEELDQYLGELEQLVNKTENVNERASLQKSIDKIKNFQTLSRLAKTSKKPMKSIKIPSVLPARTAANIGPNGAAALSMQQKIVDGVLNKWEKEEKQAVSEVMQVVGTEALTKKE